ncbi:hypothetical protein D3C78_725570 [compost metagenome]
MRRPPGVQGVAVLVDLDELQATRNHLGLCAALGGVLAHAVVDHEQHFRRGAVVVGVDQHRALLEFAAVGREDQVCGGHHQRVAGVDQVGHWLAVQTDMLLLEADAFVLLEHRRAGFADHSVTLAQSRRHMADLVAPGFAGTHLATQSGEGLGKEGADEVGLELAGLGLLHLLLDRIEVGQAHVLLDQGIAAEDFAQMFGIQCAVDHLGQLGTGFRGITVADGFDQQILEGDVVEGLAEHIEDLAAERLLLDFQLFEQLLEHRAFAGFLGDDVPQVADLGLADTVDTAETLLQAIRVPGQIVVDHQVGVLQVHAFAGRIGGDQHQHGGVIAKLFLDLAPLVAVGAAVDGDHRIRVAKHVADAGHQVVQGVAVLGEDDQLATAAAAGEHLRGILQQAGQLFPFLVLARLHHGQRLALQRLERPDFCFQLGNGFGCGSLIDYLLGIQLVLVGAEFIVQLVEVVGQLDLLLHMVFAKGRSNGLATRQQLGFFQAVFHALAPPLERLVDRLGAGGQAPLQLGQGEADRALALAVQVVGTIHLVAHVLGDIVIERCFEVGQLVVGGVGATLWEQRCAIELEQFLFDHAAHHVGDIDFVRALAELAVEAVTVQQRQPDLEVFFLAVVRGSGHQQEVAGDGAKQLAQFEPLGLVDLATEVIGRELVGFVDDDQIPLGVLQLLLVVLAARQLVKTSDQQVSLFEVVAGGALLLLLAAEDLEFDAELLQQLILPLLGQRARRHHQDALGICAHQQLTDE